MSEEPRLNSGRGLIDRKLVEAPPVILLLAFPRRHFWFVSSKVFFFSFFLGSFYCCCVYLSHTYSSIEATCPSMPAALFASRLCFIRFVCVDRSCFVWWTNAEARARIGRPQTSSSPQYFLLLAVPKRLFCFGSFVIIDVARCYLWLFTLYINTKISKNSC